MGWPTPQEYNEAIQNPHVCFHDEELQAGVVALNNLGLPRSATGSFASVYKVTVGDKQFAVRCFLHDIPDQQSRYERLSKALCADTLEYTVDFEYQPEGIRVGDLSYPIVKMAWVRGSNLDTYVRNNLSKVSLLRGLRESFREMMSALAAEGFAHGDLQHGNIIVTDEGLRLVDYDGMYVPQLTGSKSNELGHRNFQHPARAAEHFGPALDNFSAWVIDVALACIVEDASLFDKYSVGEGLLFRREDFLEPERSDLLYELEMHSSEMVRAAVRQFRTILKCSLYGVPPLSQLVPQSEESERVKAERRRREELAKRVAEWNAIQEAAKKEAEEARERRIREKEQQEREQKERQLKTHEKPGWLDEATADILARPEAAAAVAVQAAQPAAAVAIAPPSLTPVMPSAELYRTAFASPATDLHFNLRGLQFDALNNMSTTNCVLKFNGKTGAGVIKLFCRPVSSVTTRFSFVEQAIDKLKKANVGYFLPIDFIEEAVRVNGVWYPAVTMPLLKTCQSLEEVLQSTKADFDYTLLNKFRRMMSALRTAHVAHGKLDFTNIFFLGSANNLESPVYLVDYDNFCSEQLLGSNYTAAYEIDSELRHPLSSPLEYGLHIDNFAAWLIDTTILIWSVDRHLYNLLVDRKSQIFHQSDLRNPSASAALRAMQRHGSPDLNSRADLLHRILTMKPSAIPPLSRDGLPPP